MADAVPPSAGPSPQRPSQGAKTPRPTALTFGIVLALAGAIFIPFYIHWYEVGIFGNDTPQFTVVNALVPLVLFMVFLIVLLNPLLRLAAPPLRLGRRELLIIFSVWVLAATVSARQLGMRAIASAGTLYGRGVKHRTIDKAELRENYLRKDIFLPADEATKYYYGQSPDNRTWVLPFPRAPRLGAGDFADLVAFARRLSEPKDDLSRLLARGLSAETRTRMQALVRDADGLGDTLLRGLNRTVTAGESIYTPERFAQVELSEEIKVLVAESLRGDDLARLNRLLIERAYPHLVVRATSDNVSRFEISDLRSPSRLVRELYGRSDLVARFLRGKFSEASGARFVQFAEAAAACESALAADLNAVIEKPIPYGEGDFAGLSLSAETRAALAAPPEGKALLALNRTLLEEAYSGEIALRRFVVPWKQWVKPLAFWLPLVIVFVVFSSSLVRTMHRQWSQHELLTYPLAGVADSLIGVKRGRALPEIFYDRVFWAGFSVVAFIYLLDGLHRWFPQMVYIPLGWSHTNLIKDFYFLSKYCGREAYAFFRGWLYTFMVAIAVLLPLEISLTCWLGWALMVFGTGFYFLLTGETITNNETGYIQSGMQIAMGLVVLFIGRREYWNVLRTAFFMRPAEDEGMRRAANACRVFCFSFLALAYLLAFAGIDPLLSVAVTLAFALMVLLIARMTAEIGMPWLVNFRGLGSYLPMKMLGAAVMGPKGLAAMAAITLTFDHFTSNSVAAQETTISKLRERGRSWAHGTGFTLILTAGLLLALASMTFLNVWQNYSFGARRERGLVNGIGSDLRGAAGHINRLKVEMGDEGFEEMAEAKGFARLNHFTFDRKFYKFFALGALMIAGCAALRLRFSWWPFHPLPLLFFNTWAMSRVAYPIMVGWLIKTAILRVWGGKTFARSKPFWYGAILGQVFVACIWMIVTVIYYLLTRTAPVRFNSFY